MGHGHRYKSPWHAWEPTFKHCESHRLLQWTEGYVCDLPLHSNRVHRYHHLNVPYVARLYSPRPP